MKSNAVKSSKPTKSAKNSGLKIHTPEGSVAAGGPPFSNYSGTVPLRIDEICDSLLHLTDGWPKCIGDVLCYLAGEEVRVLKDASALFAWVGSHALVEWKRGARAVTKEEFFKRLHQRDRWDWATAYPHFPKVKGVYYLHKAPKADNNGKLDELIARFCPKTGRDRQLLKALILTLFWGGPPGKRPQFVIASDEARDEDAGRGTGKTTLVEYLGELVGGCIDIDPCGDRGRIVSNLLSPSSWGQRIALIDNLKSARFSHDLLEKLVTRREITGHRLFCGFGTRPNLLTWIVTVNGAFFSTDEARRSVVISLKRPKNKPSNWDAETQDFIQKHREEIVADIRWHLRVKEPATLKKVDSWRPWCMEVLSRCDNPDQLLTHIKVRRNTIDADKMEIDLALDHLRGCIISYFDEEVTSQKKPVAVDSSRVWAPSAWLVRALRTLKWDLTPRQAEQFLPRLISTGRLERANTNSQRGYLWIGKNVDPDDPPPEKTILYRPDVSMLRRRK